MPVNPATESTMDEFILYALGGGIGIALLAGPLGTFMVWRRMAYFGDTLAHSAILGVALGLLLQLDLNLSTILVCLLLAASLTLLHQSDRLSTDTLLGVLSHAALSIGLVALAVMEVRVDLMALLFGDILSIGPRELLWIWGGGAIILLTLWRIWHPLLSLTLDESLARVEGVAVERIKLLYMILIALVVALAMKIIGILLITALLIIPAASARFHARSPEQMAWMASGIGGVSAIAGILGSLQWDTPAAPTIVVVATLLFLLSQLRASR